jgi:hypothetical protein
MFSANFANFPAAKTGDKSEFSFKSSFPSKLKAKAAVTSATKAWFYCSFESPLSVLPRLSVTALNKPASCGSLKLK